ncbi:DUF4259 domain-containing protein [Pseudonocardia sp. TMWB2A]|uniref:DUF4259 domain-containing protein n=1 Tax=Pseudonocardia sp. TMWB2A TaxID=687430 RepID=UPI00307E44B5
MGAWGGGPFDNDDAADWLDELDQSDDPAATLRAAFTCLPRAGTVEAPDGYAALAAVVVLASLVGGPQLDDDLDITDAQLARIAVDPELIGAARAALRRLDSEDNELQAVWAATVEGGAQRTFLAEMDGVLATYIPGAPVVVRRSSGPGPDHAHSVPTADLDDTTVTELDRDSVRTFTVPGRLWSEKETSLYVRKGYRGFLYIPPVPRSSSTLDFVRDLPDLKSVVVADRPGNDSAIFEISTLEYLALDYTSSKAADLTTIATSVRDLLIGWRPNLHVPTSLRLRSLTVHGCTARSLAFIADQPELRELDLTLTRSHTISMTDVPDCPVLTRLDITHGAVAGLDTARLPASLRTIEFSSVTDIDLGFLRTLPGLTRLYLHRCTVRSFAPLTDCPWLRGKVFGERTTAFDHDPTLLRQFRDTPW